MAWPGDPDAQAGLGGAEELPNPRVTLATDHAPATQEALRARGIAIANEVQVYGDFYVGSFLDSEGNKLWFCSPAN